MAKHPFKSLASFLQFRYLQTRTATSVKTSLKPVATAEQLASSKAIVKKRDANLQVKEESVIALLKKQQFTDAQIAKLAEKSPYIFRCKAESTLLPKLKFLNESGFEGSYLADLISKNPVILRRSLDEHLVPSVEYLYELMNKDSASVLFVVKRATWLLTVDVRKMVQPNIDMLVKEGVELPTVLKLFNSQPRSFICGADRMQYGIETVKKFGIKPTDAMFIHALRVVLSMNESNLEKKIEVLRSLGWSDEDLVSTIMRQPLCLSQSEAKLRRAFDFFVKTMKLTPETLIKFPKLVMYSLDRRSIPRCKVLEELKKRKLLKDLNLPAVINMNDEAFMRKYILGFPKFAQTLLGLYRGTLETEVAAVQQ